MSEAMPQLQERLERVQARIAAACDRVGRAPDEVTLVAVSKTVDRTTVEAAVALGLRHFGENRVLDARDKWTDPPAGSVLHLIGQLQTNKAGPAVQLFDLIESVDRLSLIQELERQGSKRGRAVDVLIQVNVAGEEQKAGCRLEEAAPLLEAVLASPRLRLRGLMTMAPLVSDAEAVRPVFAGLRHLRDTLVRAYPDAELATLSMGMTNDFGVAIEEGATEVRIGRAIFG